MVAELTPVQPKRRIGVHVSVQQQIEDHIAAQPERKRHDMQALHRLILGVMPGCRLWFLDGGSVSGEEVRCVVDTPIRGRGSRDSRRNGPVAAAALKWPEWLY
jgi:hypothetical protein